MNRLGWVAVLLASGCQMNEPDKAKQRASEAPPPSAGDPAPTVASFAGPWSPRTDAAEFFSRPADTWEEGPLELTDFTFAVSTAAGVSTATLDVRVTNPTDGQAEAVIQLPVPPGAAVTSATLWVGEQPRVGVMLGSGEAKKIYDDIVDRRRDPLLVAWNGDDMLSVSIFPLEAKQTRRFALTWVEPAPSDRQWVPSFHHRGKLVGYPKRIGVNGSPAQLDDDWVAIPRTALTATGAFRMELQQGSAPGAVAVVVDTSGDTVADRELVWEQVRGLLSGLDASTEVTLVAADWLTRELGAGQAGADFTGARQELDTIHAAGLFEQRGAIARAREIAGASGAIVVVSNQLPSTDAEVSVDTPIFWLGDGSWHYERDIVDRSGGRRSGTGAELAVTVRRLVPPKEAGFEWLPLDSATGQVVWVGYQKGAKVDSEAAAAPVEALFYRAMLRRAEAPLNKIVSPRTSILVLESEKDYRRWGVKDEGGKLVRDRTSSQATIEELLEQGAKAPSVFRSHGGGSGSGWGTIGVGRYGTIGHGGGTGTGGSGYGQGYGRLRGRASSPPRIRIGQPQVYGELDKNIIRRYIRRVLPRIRYCYEQELLRHDNLAGTVTVEFTITVQGKVVGAKASMDHPKGDKTAACIRKVITGIVFPKPKGGGIIKVTYPFKLTPGPATLWAKASKLMEAAEVDVVDEIGALFDYQGEPDRRELAWWLADNHMRLRDSPPSAYQTVAELLRGAKSATDRDRDDARRVLSEGARRYPDIIAGTFEQWGSKDDAARVRALFDPAGNPGTRGTSGTGSGF